MASDEKGADSTAPTSYVASETESPSQYVYRDTMEAAPAFYKVDKAKVSKTELEVALLYASLNSKTTGDTFNSSLSLSSIGPYALVTIPFSKLLSVGGGLAYLNTNGTVNLSTDENSRTFKATLTQLWLPVYLVAHVTPQYRCRNPSRLLRDGLD